MTTYAADTRENQAAAGPSAVFTYRRIGPRGGVPLVLLMRFRGTIDRWDPEFVDRLAADRDVILFAEGRQAPGGGRSRRHRGRRPGRSLPRQMTEKDKP
ncbi:hypothetical protein ACIA5G_45660 [Amycolatopsis sp. NPDC051758]|uniref:hypothetical protein n=1 Tax=Amycolatopsis sp. NPDC051758 TaxID=3363935 RepID=UPI003792F020